MSRFLGNKPELPAKSCKSDQMPSSMMMPLLDRAWAFHNYYRVKQSSILSSMNVGRPSETWIAATAMLSRDASDGGGHGDGTASATHTARVNLNLLGLTDIRRRATDVSVNRRSVWAGVAAAAQALLGSDYEAQCDRVSLPVSWSSKGIYSECCLPS